MNEWKEHFWVHLAQWRNTIGMKSTSQVWINNFENLEQNSNHSDYQGCAALLCFQFCTYNIVWVQATGRSTRMHSCLEMGGVHGDISLSWREIRCTSARYSCSMIRVLKQNSSCGAFLFINTWFWHRAILVTSRSRSIVELVDAPLQHTACSKTRPSRRTLLFVAATASQSPYWPSAAPP